MNRASMGSDSDDDLDDEYDDAQDVELGFVAKVQDADALPLLLHAQPDWSQWDGGKVGGKPVWLNPRTVPTAEQLACAECGLALSFLLQIYCPLDDVDDAFHRSLYVFCCRQAGCSRQGNGKVFRAQLPQRNELYPEESGVTHFEPPVSHEAPSFCVLCNQRAVFTCSACHVARYCSKEHQKDHWSRGGHKQDCATCLQENKLIETGVEDLRAKGSKWVFPEYEMVIDHEPDAREAANEAQQDGEESDVFTDDSEIDITQRELNDAIGSSQDQDKHYIRFLTRVELAKDQVLRYSRWHEKNVLWVHSSGILEDENAIPACPHCGGERKFEFQVLPQLLFYLHVDQKSSLSEIKEKSCEWGTLAIYTCVNSCPVETKYAEEFLHYQPPYAGA
ncbi:Programmed cell death protein 2, partial [Globisporangium splendens]